ncbi:MAG: hypothetical protein H6825_04910 [Planctomycetes bacterium]|nr:hypothetical protein [Planctomycetota bacterium]
MLGLVLVLLLASLASAHEGPPYPVIVDEPHGPWLLTVWADPDVGRGTFWVQLEEDGSHRAPADTVVHVSVMPADGRLDPVTVLADPEAWGSGQKHVAYVDFPTREFWTAHFVLDSASTGEHAESVVNIEVTPPGYGTIDLLIYSWPFVAIGALWIHAIRKRTRMLAAERLEQEEAAAADAAASHDG